jgi:DNA-binding MarR family transcriptional regulator
LRITKKQILLIAAISEVNEEGGFTDIDQILENLEYRTSKQSLQFSLRALIKNGFAEKRGLECRRGQSRVVISLTKRGYEIAQLHAAMVIEK